MAGVLTESTAHIAHKKFNMSSKKQRKWLPHLFPPVMSKLRQLRGISQARALACWIATAANSRAENGQQILISLSNCFANMSHRPHSGHRYTVYAYYVFTAIIAGTLPTHLDLLCASLMTVLHHHNSTFGYLLHHNHCTTAYQQHLRKCIIATTFPLSSWARTRSAVRTSRGKRRPP